MSNINNTNNNPLTQSPQIPQRKIAGRISNIDIDSFRTDRSNKSVNIRKDKRNERMEMQRKKVSYSSLC